jgi:DNA-binding NarL/FixJ family response regulator
MNKIRIVVADGNFLTREGLKALVKENRDFLFADDTDSGADLQRKIGKVRPDVLIIDHTSTGFSLDDLKGINKTFPFLRILAITRAMSKTFINQSLDAGVNSYLLKDCDKVEINEAIYATAKGEQFFCGKIVSNILNAPEEGVMDNGALSCDGIRISSREAEIIRLVAEGLSNKEIADKLFLSVHTITTHRKNIMSKLGVNNTAGLVLFALKQNIISPNKYLFSSEN